MGFLEFSKKICRLCNKSGERVYTRDEGSRFFAETESGIAFVGRPSASKITVRWGSGHQAMVTI